MKNIATEFKLWDLNPDPWAWILYGTRYTEDQLRLKQQQVILVLEGRVIFEDTWNNIIAKSIDMNPYEQTTLVLIEELACINESLDLHANQPDIAGKGLTRALEHNPIMDITHDSVGEGKLVELYNRIDIGWGQIIKDIGIAENQNGILTSRQRRLFNILRRNQLRALCLLQGNHWLLQLSFS